MFDQGKCDISTANSSAAGYWALESNNNPPGEGDIFLQVCGYKKTGSLCSDDSDG